MRFAFAFRPGTPAVIGRRRAAGPAAPYYIAPTRVIASGSNSNVVVLPGHARKAGMFVLVFAWRHNSNVAQGEVDGWTLLGASQGSSGRAGAIYGKVLADGDALSYTFPNASKTLFEVYENIDPAGPLGGIAVRVQNTPAASMTWPALARSVADRGAVFTRCSGISQNTPQADPPEWVNSVTTGASAGNCRISRPSPEVMFSDLSEDTIALAINVQGIAWTVELNGVNASAKPSYPWALGPVGAKFAAIGDSITAAVGDISYHEQAFAAVGLDTFIRDTGYNFGHSGWTSTQLATQGSLVRAYQPDVIVLMCGTNDPVNDITVETTQANLRQMIDYYTAGGSRVVLGTILPNENGPTREAHRLAANAWIRQQTDVLLWDNNAIGFNTTDHTSDGTHPNAAGASLLGASLAPVLSPLAPAI